MPEAGHDKMVGAVLEFYAPPSGGGADPGALLEEIPLQFNPAELALVKEASWVRHSSRSAPHAAVPEFTGSKPRTLAMTVILDDPDPQNSSVDERVSKLLEFCAPTEESLHAEQPSPAWVKFRWGAFESVSFVSFLCAVKATYTRFSAQGNPLRAVCEISLEEIGSVAKGQNPTSGSPAFRQSCVFVRGDSLQSVAARNSGRPADWRRIAELNNVDDPSKIEPGRVLLLPGGTDQ
ncbi:LysM peptidoglycan-binding domain-containing protein [Streptomyces olivoreticuli]|uniref:CIS tube protein n=1 Tax=Streptomyces olivoreticuli TaxID=68246 RepID=UPI00265816CE|nr:LysM peptidoglycan-binding domain-containing protein [Streptomyces olivoreticuli]WKK24348.1 LysM peptidoglycan-binding domain-containing protein [Streptomyces olivoreticuli]